MPAVPLAGLRPGAALRLALWLQAHELAEAAKYVRQHRTSSGPFDAVKGREIVTAFCDGGATWWLEWMNSRGTFAQMREHVGKGPSKVRCPILSNSRQ
jgi:hypothetical protein